MIRRNSHRCTAAVLLAMSLCAGCTTTQPTPRVESSPPPPPPAPPPEPELLKIPIVVTPKNRELIPPGATIVIADIAGLCAQEVKTALMKRLVDNADYNVVTRDNLRQIISEADQSWAGKFNTDTATKLGELMGASLWIVGRVAHCEQSVSDEPENEVGTEYKIMAVLQVIDIATGKVLVASASEGRYSPQTFVPLELERAKPAAGVADHSESSSAQLEPGDARSEDGETRDFESGEKTVPADSETGVQVASAVAASLRDRTLPDPIATPLSRLRDHKISRIPGDETPPTEPLRRANGSKGQEVTETQEYAVMRAADELASGFADKFFGRPLWEDVTMWNHPLRRYSEATVLVQLGQCPLAVRLMDEVASLELYPMTEQEVAQYLHNFGVALLCANEPEKAAEKLRAAYRLSQDKTTLDMLGLAGKIVEWSLAVEVDKQPEIEMLIKRDLTIRGR